MSSHCFTSTEVDLGPLVHQIPVIAPPSTTCLYPGSTDMTVHITTTGNPFVHRSSAPSVHSQHSSSRTISAPSSHKDWQSFFECSSMSTDLSTLSHELYEAQDKASILFSDCLIRLGSRMAFRLNALVTTSENWKCTTAQWRRQARVIVQDFFSTDLPTNFATYTQALQKSVNHWFCTASHLTLKSASDFARNIITEATEMSPGQATYFLHWVLDHAKAITDSEKMQIPSFPEKELLLQSLADNPALCLVLMNHPVSPAPSSSVGLALGAHLHQILAGSQAVYIEFQQIHSHCLAPLQSTAYQNSMLPFWNCFKPGCHLTPSARASSRCLGLDPLKVLCLCLV